MADLLTAEFLVVITIGFVAQSIDGALGMAFGVVASSAMMAYGLPPAHASAVAHTAEIFTTAASGASHVYHGNIDRRLVIRLGIAGVIGAVLGAWVLSNVDAGLVRPFVAVYLVMVGTYILLQAMRYTHGRDAPAPWTAPVGLVAGFLDASGGGGWGPVATSALVGSGHAPRLAVGSVSATEFFVTVAAATTFLFELGASPLPMLAGLVLGGLLAAPFGGYLVKRIPPAVLMAAVGVLIILLAIWQLARALALI